MASSTERHPSKLGKQIIPNGASKGALAECIHWWDINQANIGVCRLCGATKEFTNTVKKKTWEGRKKGEA